MIKRQLIEAVVKYSGQPTEVVTRVLDTYMAVVRRELAQPEGTVEVRGFGKFHQVLQKAKVARRMTGKPGESVPLPLPERLVVRFKPSGNWTAPVDLQPTAPQEKERPYAAALSVGKILEAHRQRKNTHQF